VGEQDQKPAVL